MTACILDEGYSVVKEDYAGTCTYAGDANETHAILVGDSERVMVLRDSQQGRSIEFINFPEGELEQARPVAWRVQCHENTAKAVLVNTLRGYLEARFELAVLHPLSEMADGVHKMPLDWGDQFTECLWLIVDGKLMAVHEEYGYDYNRPERLPYRKGDTAFRYESHQQVSERLAREWRLSEIKKFTNRIPTDAVDVRIINRCGKVRWQWLYE